MRNLKTWLFIAAIALLSACLFNEHSAAVHKQNTIDSLQIVNDSLNEESIEKGWYQSQFERNQDSLEVMNP